MEEAAGLDPHLKGSPAEHHFSRVRKVSGVVIYSIDEGLHRQSFGERDQRGAYLLEASATSFFPAPGHSKPSDI